MGLPRRARRARARARARARHLHGHLARVAALSPVGEQVPCQAHEQLSLLVHGLDRCGRGRRAALRGGEGLLQLRAALCARLLQQGRRLGQPRATKHREGHVALRLRRRRHRLRLVVLLLRVALERLAARDGHAQAQRRAVDPPRRVVHHGRPAPAVASQLAEQRDPHLHEHVHRLLLVRHLLRLRAAAAAARARRVRGVQRAHARLVHEREQRLERGAGERSEGVAAARHQPEQQHAAVHQSGGDAAAALGRELLQPGRKQGAAVRRRGGGGGGGVWRAAHGGGGVQQQLCAVRVRLGAAVEAVAHRAELHEQLAQRVLERARRLGPRVLRRRPRFHRGGQQREGAARQLSAAQRLAPARHQIGGRAHARRVEARPLRLALAALVRRRERGAHPLEVPAERRAEQRGARCQQRQAAAALGRRRRVQWLQPVELLRCGAEEGQQARLLEGQPRARVQRPGQAAGGGGAVRRAKLSEQPVEQLHAAGLLRGVGLEELRHVGQQRVHCDARAVGRRV